MERIRFDREVDSAVLLAVSCLCAGLGIGLTGLSLLAETVVPSCVGCVASSPVGASIRLLAAAAPTLAGAALASAGGWLLGRCR